MRTVPAIWQVIGVLTDNWHRANPAGWQLAFDAVEARGGRLAEIMRDRYLKLRDEVARQAFDERGEVSVGAGTGDGPRARGGGRGSARNSGTTPSGARNYSYAPRRFGRRARVGAVMRTSQPERTSHMNTIDIIDIKGIDKAELLAALHNGTRAQGMGRLHDIGRDLTREEAAQFVAPGEPLRFDYLLGRPLKVDISKDELYVGLYDRDAGEGRAAAVVASLRAKKTTE